MVDYPVSEIGCKDFSPFRITHKKARRCARLIRSGPQLIGKAWDIEESNTHVFDCMNRRHFVSYAIMVGYPYRKGEGNWHHNTECCDCPNNVTVVLVVVVRVTIVEVHVPRVVAVVLSGTPVVAAFLRFCIFVTATIIKRSFPLDSSSSKPPIQSIM